MSTRIRSNIGLFTHDNYNAAVSPGGTKTLPAQCTSIYIENMDVATLVYVSFDGGTTWKTIKAGSALGLDCDNLISYKVKSASGTPAVEALYGSEA